MIASFSLFTAGDASGCGGDNFNGTGHKLLDYEDNLGFGQGKGWSGDGSYLRAAVLAEFGHGSAAGHGNAYCIGRGTGNSPDGSMYATPA